MTELELITTSEQAIAWARQSLPAKNTLTADDARIVEEAFQAKMIAPPLDEVQAKADGASVTDIKDDRSFRGNREAARHFPARTGRRGHRPHSRAQASSPAGQAASRARGYTALPCLWTNTIGCSSPPLCPTTSTWTKGVTNLRFRYAASTMERFIAAAMKVGGGRMLAWMPSPSLATFGHEHDLLARHSFLATRGAPMQARRRNGWAWGPYSASRLFAEENLNPGRHARTTT
jgi:hypothetical protein